MRPFSKKLFNAVIVIVSLFCLVKCSESNEKSLLSSKLQSAVSKLSEIVTRLDPSSGLAKIPLPSKPSVSVVESAAKRRPPDVCSPAVKCPLPGCTEEETAYALSLLKQYNVQSKKHEVCGKLYDFHTKELDVDEAQKSCCNNNLTLISLDSKEELECITKIYKLERSPPKLLLTSGRLDKTCSAGYSWCSQTASANVGQIVPWKEGGSDASKGNCVALDMTNLDKIVLTNVKCLTKLRYFCESRIF